MTGAGLVKLHATDGFSPDVWADPAAGLSAF